ncbi:MAG: DUF87 domain-containing protein [Acetobacteraceae bacterium]
MITDVILEDRLAIVGTTGSGKTFAAKGMAEALIAGGARVCVVDPLGVWWGLRAGPDGDPAGGLPVTIFGGLHGDIPITDQDGRALARILADSDLRCIVDVSEVGSGAARRRFMSAFAEALYDANRRPLHLILDEADLWAPQRPLPDQTALQGKIGEIVRRGRVRGFVPWLITQRPAVLDKDVLSQADTLIAMKLTSSQDRNAIGAWIEGQADRAEGKRMLAQLARLQVGTGLVWSPGHDVLQQVAFPGIATFDSSRTPTRGQRVAARSLAPVDVSAIATLLAGQRRPEPASAKRNPDDLAAAEERGYQRGRAEAAAELAGLRDQVRAMQTATAEGLRALLAQVEAAPTGGAAALQVLHRPVRPASDAGATRRARPQGAARSDATLHAAARALLAVLASRTPARLTWNQAATLAGLKARGGHFNAGRQQLRAEGLVVEDGSLVWATDAGVARAGDVREAPTSPAEIRAMWCARLPAPAPQMVGALAAHGSMTVTELAARLGKQPRGGHWNGGMAVLRNNGLVTVAGQVVTLAKELSDG